MELLCAIVIAIHVCHFTLNTHTDLNQPVGLCGAHSAATLDTDANEQLTSATPAVITPATPVAHFRIRKIMPYKSKKYLNVLEKYLKKRSTFEMYLSTSTSTLVFSAMYLSTF